MATDVQLNFSGFDPDETLRVVVANVAERLYFIAPSDSAMKLVVEKSKDAIQASCRIASRSGIFKAVAVHSNPSYAVQSLESKIKGQLERWKRSRFSNTGERSHQLRA